jgi:STE24 endopeptidase
MSVSVILLLLLFVIWLATPDGGGRDSLVRDGPVVFIGGYVLMVLMIGQHSRWLVRRVGAAQTFRRLIRFSRRMPFAQMFIPAWLAFGILGLGWERAVRVILGPVAWVESFGLLLGVLPSLLAWMGLWWATYPVDRALREQSLLNQLDGDLPIYAPPSFSDYFFSKLRMQVLFTTVPVFMIVALRDFGGWGLLKLHLIEPTAGGDAIVSAAAALIVFIISPEVLRRVLATERLADTELRERLWGIANRDRVRCRDVLLWRTHNTVGNAAVMGLVRWFRYVLLSDLLLETLRDEEVLAVFAHEVGHVVHRHMMWFAVSLVTLTLAMGAAGDASAVAIERMGFSPAMLDQILPFMSIIMFVLCFGFLSQRFERQADVHAARTMQAMSETPAADHTWVGPAGAAAFNSALLRVSDVNNIPPEVRGRFTGNLRQRIAFITEWLGSLAGSWLHGTMASRMRFVSSLTSDPKLTDRFDRQMDRLRIGLVALLLACVGWTFFQHERGASVFSSAAMTVSGEAGQR